VRNKVLLEVASVIAALRPSCAIVENVPALLAEKNSTILNAFKRRVRSAGYRIVTITANSSDFGVPQLRKRAFFIITMVKLDNRALRACLIKRRTTALNVREALAGLTTPLIRVAEYCDDDEVTGTPNHIAMRHSQAVIEKISAIEPGYGPMSYRKLDPDKPAKTLMSGHRAPPVHFCEPRSLTVREAMRLQGFPDSFRVYGSFSHQMRQVTNAVPPPLALAVLETVAELVCLPINCHG
jgi:DNA (cytosine-5)-methyltransferase 1